MDHKVVASFPGAEKWPVSTDHAVALFAVLVDLWIVGLFVLWDRCFCLLDCFGGFAILIDQILLGVLSNALEIIIVKDGCMIEEHVTSERKHLFDQFSN